MEELDKERQLSPLPPVVVGGALVIPLGLLRRLRGVDNSEAGMFARETKRVEQIAIAAVMKIERDLGYEPKDLSSAKCGYDIESKIPGTGKLRFIEVKGRIAGAETVTVTKNEILSALNKPENYYLALVKAPLLDNTEDSNETIIDLCKVSYVQKPFSREPDFGASSVNYSWKQLWEKGKLIDKK